MARLRSRLPPAAVHINPVVTEAVDLTDCGTAIEAIAS